MLPAAEIARLLEPFSLTLDSHQLELIGRYAELLIHWNRKINLTAIRNPAEIISRHFGESLYVSRFAELNGSLLDVGSGAGFPGLALKIVRPGIRVVLLEPVAKKRAFLKEVARQCRFNAVEVEGARIEDFVAEHEREFASITLRAVGGFERVLPATSRCLADDGRVYAWLTRGEAVVLRSTVQEFERLFTWSEPIKLPLSRDREIWVGARL